MLVIECMAVFCGSRVKRSVTCHYPDGHVSGADRVSTINPSVSDIMLRANANYVLEGVRMFLMVGEALMHPLICVGSDVDIQNRTERSLFTSRPDFTQRSPKMPTTYIVVHGKATESKQTAIKIVRARAILRSERFAPQAGQWWWPRRSNSRLLT